MAKLASPHGHSPSSTKSDERASIIIGMFVYEIVVVRMGHSQAIAGALAIAIMGASVTSAYTETCQPGAGRN